VATDVSGTTEAVEHGVEALVVPPEDPSSLAEAVVRVLSDRDLAARLGNSALERAERQFGYGRMLDELETALTGGVERKRRRA
jgi:glycosyltransferase involved in cell wall biosynthesis